LALNVATSCAVLAENELPVADELKSALSAPLPYSAALPVAEPLKSEARLPVEGKNTVAVALAKNDVVSEPVPYKAAEPVPESVVSADNVPDTTSAEDPVADKLNVPLRFALPGRDVDAEPEALKVELNDPCAGKNTVASAFALNDPDKLPVAENT
jgi:hypothetical protein